MPLFEKVEEEGGDVFDPTEGLDDEGQAFEVEEEPDPQTRDQKKRARYDQMAEEARIAREEAQRTRTEMMQLHQQMHEMRQSFQQGPPVQQPSPVDLEIETIENERETMRRDFEEMVQNGKFTKEKQSEYWRKGKELEEKLFAARFRKYGGGQQVASNPVIGYMQLNHADVMQDRRALNWAAGRYAQLLAEGMSDNVQSIDRVMNEARQKFGKGTPFSAPPGDDIRQRYGGAPAGGGSGGGGTRSIKMTRDLMVIAEKMYPDLSPREAHKKWVQTVGPDFIKETQRKAG